MKELANLLILMAKLRDPAMGSPWEKTQTFESIANYTIEEAYEVVDAIHRNDLPALRDELGDLLLQVIFHARIAEEAGVFNFEDVVKALATKLEQRLPHMFGRGSMPKTVEEQDAIWQSMKPLKPTPESVLDNISPSLPPFERMVAAQAASEKAGWRWSSAQSAIEKIHEEANEVGDAATDGDHVHLTEEMGDLFSVVISLCIYLKVAPNEALKMAREKHSRRFRHVEKRAKEHGLSIADAPHDQERAWYAEIKALEKKAS